MSQNKPIPEEESWLAIVRKQIRSLHFGVVQIVVHNDRVVQIDRTEKVRLTEKNSADDLSPQI